MNPEELHSLVNCNIADFRNLMLTYYHQGFKFTNGGSILPALVRYPIDLDKFRIL